MVCRYQPGSNPIPSLDEQSKIQGTDTDFCDEKGGCVDEMADEAYEVQLQDGG
jgi:hypothetical protein